VVYIFDVSSWQILFQKSVEIAKRDSVVLTRIPAGRSVRVSASKPRARSASRNEKIAGSDDDHDDDDHDDERRKAWQHTPSGHWLRDDLIGSETFGV
jgi:hypothetical protein